LEVPKVKYFLSKKFIDVRLNIDNPYYTQRNLIGQNKKKQLK